MQASQSRIWARVLDVAVVLAFTVFILRDDFPPSGATVAKLVLGIFFYSLVLSFSRLALSKLRLRTSQGRR
jgi:hypothetical protein